MTHLVRLLFGLSVYAAIFGTFGVLIVLGWLIGGEVGAFVVPIGLLLIGCSYLIGTVWQASR